MSYELLLFSFAIINRKQRWKDTTKEGKENCREKQVNLIEYIKKREDSKSINQTISQLSSPRPKSNTRIKNNPFVLYLLQNTKRHTHTLLVC